MRLATREETRPWHSDARRGRLRRAAGPGLACESPLSAPLRRLFELPEPVLNQGERDGRPFAQLLLHRKEAARIAGDGEPGEIHPLRAVEEALGRGCLE